MEKLIINKIQQNDYNVHTYNSFIPLNKKSNFVPLAVLNHKNFDADIKKRFQPTFILDGSYYNKLIIPPLYISDPSTDLGTAKTDHYFNLQQSIFIVVKSIYEKEHIYYALCKGTCILLNNDLSINRILYTTVIYKPAIELLYLSGSVNPKFVKLLITNNITPHIKNYLKKYILPSAHTRNIESIYVNNFDEIVSNKPIPKLKNFKAMKEIYAKEAIKRYFDYTESTT